MHTAFEQTSCCALYTLITDDCLYTPTGSHAAKLAGCTPEYAAPEVVSSCMLGGADLGVLRPSMDTYSMGLVALQMLDVSGKPRTARFMASSKQRGAAAYLMGCIYIHNETVN